MHRSVSTPAEPVRRPAVRRGLLCLLLAGLIGLLAANRGTCEVLPPEPSGTSAAARSAPAEDPDPDPERVAPPVLTAPEQALVAGQPRLVVAFAEAPPYAMERGGIFMGYSVELMEHAARAVGLHLEWRRLPLDQGVAAVAGGTAQVILNLVQTPGRRSSLRFGEHTARVDSRIFARIDRPDLKNLDGLGQARVAVWPGYPFLDLISQRSPGVKFVTTGGYAEALRAVEEGRADLVVVERVLGRKVIAERGLTRLVEQGPADLFPPPGVILSLFAVRRDQRVLAGLLDKALDAIPAALRQSIWRRWLGAADTPAALRARIRLTETELAEIAAHPDLVLGVDAEWSPLIIRHADGSFSGIDADTVDLINQTLGTRIRFETGRWPDQVARAMRGDIDGLSASAVHPERAGSLLFTRPYTEAGQAVFVRAGNPLGVRTLQDLDGRRVAYLRGNLAAEKFVRQLPEATPVPVESARDAANRLLGGDVDILFNDDFFHFWALDHDLGAIETAFTLPEGLPLVFSIRKERRLLASAIDKVLGAMPPELRAGIKGRYMNPLAARDRESVVPPLSDDERDYLRHKDGVLRYCFSPVWIPYDYLDNGEHRGTFREYLDLFGRKLGVRFVALPAATWPGALRLAEDRQCDLVSGLVRTAERERSFAFTSPYLNLTLVLVARAEAPFVAGIEDLAGKPIGLPTHTAIATALRARMPRQPFVDLGNIAEFEHAITRGRVYAAVTTLEHAAELIDRSLGRLRIIGKLDDPYPISVAVRKDEPALLAIMQKAVDSVTPAERDRISGRRTIFHLEQSLDLTRLWQFLGAMVLLGLFLGWRQWELTRLNRRLVRARDAAEVANRAKGEFLANMSHEIRTPLNAVLNLAALGQQAREPERLRGYLAEIERAGGSLRGVIDEILDFSRLEGGAEAVRADPFVLGELVERVRGIAAPLAVDKGLRLETTFDPRLAGTWVGDAHKLERVLVNLLGNAVKFTDQGAVRLAVGEAPAEPMHGASPAAAEGGVRVCFAVCDTGIGIADGQLQRLCAPFEQGDNSASRRHGGTGLGLTIVRRLVDLMGGSLSLESRPGVGACFRVFVTLLRAPAASTGLADAPVSADPGHPRAGPGRRVLVVEDNALTRTIVLEYLRLLGVAGEAVADGESALASLDRDPQGFGLVLMDIQMPGLDGLETTRRLRADPRFARLPVIALTAHVLEQDRARCRAAGMDDHLPKPFDRSSFTATLARWLPPLDTPAPDAAPTASADSAGLPAAEPGGSAGAAWSVPAAWLDTSEGVRRTGGDPDLYGQLLEKFVTEYAPRLAESRALAAAGDWQAIAVLVHRLRGTAPMIGAVPLAAAAAALDEQVRDGAAPAAETLARFTAALAATLDSAGALMAVGDPAFFLCL